MTEIVLPGVVKRLAALITTGTSVFGWDADRDGVPEVVTRAYERIGTAGCEAIWRRALAMNPGPRFADAARLVVWGMECYWGQVVRSDVADPQWSAQAELMRQVYAEKIAQRTAVVESRVPWVECIDWMDVAQRAEESGAAVFTVHTRREADTCTTEVDLFVTNGVRRK